MAKTLSWYLMTVLAIAIGLYALGNALSPALRQEFILDMIAEASAGGTLLHFLTGGVVIIVGALQFNAGLRSKYLHAHRFMGKVYVVGCIVGGFAGLYLAFYSTGGIVSHWGFGMLAVCWIVTTLMAYRHIRAGNVRIHQDWMIRSYSLTLAAVTLRIYLPISQISGFGFEESYQAIAWMCWVPNLIIAEWFIIPLSNRRRVLS
ncbi:MAG: hypothetical protein DHS20C12_18300 [Pseudohongiella sp.]|nr:MAG: hypothetical protein DHS20C12_18300 [Pseudohongiella sp.]